MADEADNSVELRQFAGLILHTDRHDLPPGAAQKQINIRSDRPGELNVRRGMRLIQFDEE